MTQMIRVGGFWEPVEKATRLVREYVTEYGKWSYPAYDGYLRHAPTDDVRQQDLLAAALLNAGQQPIPTCYGLLQILPEINRRLEGLGLVPQPIAEDISSGLALFNGQDELVVRIARTSDLRGCPTCRNRNSLGGTLPVESRWSVSDVCILLRGSTGRVQTTPDTKALEVACINRSFSI
jgi:Family of unknown function (DUF6308)